MIEADSTQAVDPTSKSPSEGMTVKKGTKYLSCIHGSHLLVLMFPVRPIKRLKTGQQLSYVLPSCTTYVRVKLLFIEIKLWVQMT